MPAGSPGSRKVWHVLHILPAARVKGPQPLTHPTDKRALHQASKLWRRSVAEAVAVEAVRVELVVAEVAL